MIKKLLRWSGLALLLVFAGMQVFQPERTNPPVLIDVGAPAEVDRILRGACYDCHSHETRWPWYGYVAPISWLLADHVEHARGDLNFSRWPKYDLEAREHTFEEIREQITDDEMPLESYRLLHREARLSDADKAELLRWTGADRAGDR